MFKKKPIPEPMIRVPVVDAVGAPVMVTHHVFSYYGSTTGYSFTEHLHKELTLREVVQRIVNELGITYTEGTKTTTEIPPRLNLPCKPKAKK